MKRMIGCFTVFVALGTVSTGAAQVSSIRDIDFKNFAYVWDHASGAPPEAWHWIASPPHLKIKVSNGIHHFHAETQDDRDREIGPLITVDAVTYGDLIGDGDEEAIVSLNYSTGGTANWDFLYVYRLKNGIPSLLARMQTGSRGYGGLVDVSVRDRSLVVDFADKDRTVGDCCSAGFVRVRYRWRGVRFVEVGNRGHGDMDLQTGRPVVPGDKALAPEN
jgi:hypothetical protein